MYFMDANSNSLFVMPSGTSVMLHLCSMIPKLKTRQGKAGGDHGSQGGGSSGAGGGGSKKKGKGRR